MTTDERIARGVRVRCDSGEPGLARVSGHSGRVVEMFAEGTIARVAWDGLNYRDGRSIRQLVTDIGTSALTRIVN